MQPPEYKEQYMTAAAEAAMRSVERGDGTPFGALLLRDATNEVVAVASNTVLRDLDPTCHAETNAVRAACKKEQKLDLSDCVMYATTKPCPMCLSAMAFVHIPFCFYANTYMDARDHGYGCQHVIDRVVHNDESIMKLTHVERNESVSELWAVAARLKEQSDKK